MSDTNTVQISRSTIGITTITINRPRLRNAVDSPTARKLYDALRAFDVDETQKICMLTGADGAFCAGFDLHTVSQSPLPAEPFGESPSIAPMGPSRLRLSKPLIAAVEGYAVAGGLELALLADMRICSETAVFGVFCRRWGVPLIDGGTVRLQHIVGCGRAMDMILTGRAVDAREALGIGLANRVVPKGQALAKATQIAEELLRWPQKCLRADRESAYYAAFDAGTFRDAMQNEFVEGSKVVQAESVHGAATFSRGAGRHGDFGGKIAAKL
ncbi:hypothetical protein LTR91_000199 [Friedmanniomyces endolithicus]|uniref:Enoyl-CoA hydratase n=1 Tax=Friedmanniomyces endolithicus TaxID=329885 RepID=A0A4U0V1D0_9PEZI|nr:hypothetical protein LTS09_008419 [Friedmanniomyces endolithicus]KAK0281207.1 hypothetical protein LTR35_007582 [Friedmanniomyces endolithicus]KAK0295169.1 hypothetical protein LTS00_006226 [Friedmanniomyces endolithicus]KAK0313895.1 hypothetical protein LTR01_002152 [Friedmanniomyces endolithicus]KAK0317275.1 hypothetical protein LTR82_011597 [Friedmanniomyces endolithicus]